MRSLARVAAILGVCLTAVATAGASSKPEAPLIVFSGARAADRYTVYTVRPDGSGRRSLGGAYLWAQAPRPVWSRDGRRVAFSGERGLAVVDAAGTRRREIDNGFDDETRDSASWSPDGRTVVVPGESRLWLFDVGGGRARKTRVTGDLPTFSPDGKLIAFFGGGLRVMNRDGTGIRRVAAATGTTDSNTASPPSWSPDGRRIAFETGGLVRVHDLRSGRTSVVTGGRGRQDTEPAWSPDGRWIAFVRGAPATTSDTRTGVAVVRPDGRGLRVLTDAPYVETSPTWSPDSHRIAYLGGPLSNDGPSSAYVVAVAGGPSRRLLRSLCGADQISALTWGRGGRLAFASRVIPNDAQIYVSRTDGTGVRGLATSCTEETDPTVAPDGRRIAYVRGGDIYVMGADGSHKRRLVSGAEPDWSPSGEAIVFSRGGATRQIYIVPAAGGAVVGLTSVGSNTDPSWSGAGDRIAFTGKRGQSFQVYTMRADGSDQRQVTALGGRQPSWSPDGNRIAFVSGPNLFSIGADGTDPRALTRYDACTELFDPAWSPDGSTIAFAIYSNDQEAGGIAFVPAAGGDVKWMPRSPFVGAWGAEEAIFSRSPDWFPSAVSRLESAKRVLTSAQAAARSAGCIDSG